MAALASPEASDLRAKVFSVVHPEVVKDREIRRLLLEKYYQLRRDPPTGLSPHDFEGRLTHADIGHVSKQLAEQGLIDWIDTTPYDGQVCGFGHLTARGIDVVEAWAGRVPTNTLFEVPNTETIPNPAFIANARALRSDASAPANPMNIKYGMILRLRHQTTGRLLRSWDKCYPPPSISKQQVVSATNDESDSGTHWRVKGPDGTADDFEKSKPVKHGAVIRLEHVNTRTNLHSHRLEDGHLAFHTRDGAQQEVTCAGILGKADSNDNWRVEVEGDGDWVANAVVRLVHVNTGHPLHSHRNSVPELDGQQEITAYVNRDENDHFLALPVEPPKPPLLAKISSRDGAESVRRLLRQFADCVGYALGRRKKPVLNLDSEPGIQDLLFFMLKPSIPDLTAESPVAGRLRQFSVVDFRSRKLRLVIEAKRPRDKAHARRMHAELNDDIHKYRDDPNCKDLFFVIYDPDHLIEGPAALAKSMSGPHQKGNRSVRVHCIIVH